MNTQNGFSEGMAVEMEYKAGQSVVSELNNSRFMNYYISVEETIRLTTQIALRAAVQRLK
jgi:hypothetical protein